MEEEIKETNVVEETQEAPKEEKKTKSPGKGLAITGFAISMVSLVNEITDKFLVPIITKMEEEAIATANQGKSVSFDTTFLDTFMKIMDVEVMILTGVAAVLSLIALILFLTKKVDGKKSKTPLIFSIIALAACIAIAIMLFA